MDQELEQVMQMTTAIKIFNAIDRIAAQRRARQLRRMGYGVVVDHQWLRVTIGFQDRTVDFWARTWGLIAY